MSLSWKLFGIVLLSLISGLLTFALLLPLLRYQLNQQISQLNELRQTYQRVNAALQVLPHRPQADRASQRQLIAHLRHLMPDTKVETIYLVDLTGGILYQSRPTNRADHLSISRVLQHKLQPGNIFFPEPDSFLFFPIQFTDAGGYLLIRSRYPHYYQEFLDRYTWYVGSIFLCSILVFCVVLFLLQRPRILYLLQLARQVEDLAESQFKGQVTEVGQDELGALARSINEMARQLVKRMEEARLNEQARYELITSLSHDLKSPLTSILGYLELLQNHPSLPSDNTPHHYAITAYRKAELLNKRISRLFEYSQLNALSERELFQLVPTNITILLQQLSADYIPLFERRGITVQINIPANPIILPIDQHHWVRALENLFHNAVLYAAPDSLFSIYLTQQPEFLQLVLENELERELRIDAEHLFDQFYREDRARRSEGSGLGLSITRRIFELHGSKITAHCQENQLQFQVVIPMSLPANQLAG